MLDNLFAKGSLFDLIVHGTIFGYIILILLTLMSVTSWALALYKYFFFYRSFKDSKNFLKMFYQKGKITEASSFIDNFPMAYTAQIFHSSYKEYSKFYSQYREIIENKTVVNNVELPLKREFKDDLVKRLERNIETKTALQNKVQERGLNTLAVISSSSPYLGLLGTVTGIINAFLNIGSQGETSLASVAPGIAEALVTTALGLLTAIPALIFYNYFRSMIRKINNDQYTFGLELINIYEKSV